jgi:hypothetical protein
MVTSTASCLVLSAAEEEERPQAVLLGLQLLDKSQS